MNRRFIAKVSTPVLRRAATRLTLIVLAVLFFLASIIVVQSACLLIDGHLNFRSGREVDQLIAWASLGISAVIASWIYRRAADLWLPPPTPTFRMLEPGSESSDLPPVLNYSRLTQTQANTPIQATLAYVAGTVILLLGIFSVLFPRCGAPAFWFLAPVAVAGIAMGTRTWRRTRFSLAKLGANFAALGAAFILLAKLRG